MTPMTMFSARRSVLVLLSLLSFFYCRSTVLVSSFSVLGVFVVRGPNHLATRGTTCTTPTTTATRQHHAIPVAFTTAAATATKTDTALFTSKSVDINDSETQPKEMCVVKDESSSLSLVERRLLKLDRALRSSFNSTDAADLLDELKIIREQQQEQGSTSSSSRISSIDSSSVEGVLQELLQQGPDRKQPSLLLKVLLMMPRYSKRARLASLRRALDLTTPPPAQEEEAADNDSVESQQRRRRRALMALLRTLAKPAADGGFLSDSKIPAIRQIEKQAAKEQSLKGIGTDNLILRRPTDLETPAYTVVQKLPAGGRKRGGKSKNNIEIRNYEDYAVCTVSMNQERAADPRTDAVLNEPAKGGVKAFGALAGYLFGKNADQTAMKMTTPVLTTEDKRMSFVLPSTYWTNEAAAPKPLEGSGVTVERVEGGSRAVLLFGGYAVAVDARKQELLDLINSSSSSTDNNEWEVVPGARPVLAQYNDPFTPPWKRLNEVSVAVRPRSSSSSS